MVKSTLSGKNSLLAATGTALASTLSNAEPAESRPVTDKPNVILIMADDLGWETVGAYGGDYYKTPRIDALAKKGVTFEHAYSTPLCTPTRVMMMTGLYGHRNYREFGKFPKQDAKRTFGNLMQEAGYATCMAGKWHVKGVTARKMGFDRAMRCEAWGGFWGHKNIWINDKKTSTEEAEKRFPDREYRPDMVADFIIDFIEDNKDQPFFAYYPMYLVHHPEQPTPDSADVEEFRKNPKDWKLTDQTFSDMVTYMDKLVGRVVDKVDELGIRENTIIMFTGDNGTCVHTIEIDGKPAGGGKGSMKDRGTRVPLVVNWQNNTPQGVMSDELVDFTDFYPTLAELVDVPTQTVWQNDGIFEKQRSDKSIKTTDGVSFLSEIKGEKKHRRDWAFMHYKGRDSGKWPVTAGAYWARTERYKLYHNGNLYDLKNDRPEKSPLPPAKDTPELAKTRALLKNVFEKLEATPDTIVSEEAERIDRESGEWARRQRLKNKKKKSRKK